MASMTTEENLPQARYFGRTVIRYDSAEDEQGPYDSETEDRAESPSENASDFASPEFAFESIDPESAVAVILRCKSVLEDSGSQRKDLLTSLRTIHELGSLSTEILKETLIGKTLSSLAKTSTSSQVRYRSWELVTRWRQEFQTRKQKVVAPCAPPSDAKLTDDESHIAAAEAAQCASPPDKKVTVDESRIAEADVAPCACAPDKKPTVEESHLPVKEVAPVLNTTTVDLPAPDQAPGSPGPRKEQTVTKKSFTESKDVELIEDLKDDEPQKSPVGTPAVNSEPVEDVSASGTPQVNSGPVEDTSTTAVLHHVSDGILKQMTYEKPLHDQEGKEDEALQKHTEHQPSKNQIGNGRLENEPTHEASKTPKDQRPKLKMNRASLEDRPRRVRLSSTSNPSLENQVKETKRRPLEKMPISKPALTDHEAYEILENQLEETKHRPLEKIRSSEPALTDHEVYEILENQVEEIKHRPLKNRTNSKSALTDHEVSEKQKEKQVKQKVKQVKQKEDQLSADRPRRVLLNNVTGAALSVDGAVRHRQSTEDMSRRVCVSDQRSGSDTKAPSLVPPSPSHEENIRVDTQKATKKNVNVKEGHGSIESQKQKERESSELPGTKKRKVDEDQEKHAPFDLTDIQARVKALLQMKPVTAPGAPCVATSKRAAHEQREEESQEARTRSNSQKQQKSINQEPLAQASQVRSGPSSSEASKTTGSKKRKMRAWSDASDSEDNIGPGKHHQQDRREKQQIGNGSMSAVPSDSQSPSVSTCKSTLPHGSPSNISNDFQREAFKPGERVEYYSSTKQDWVRAAIVSYHQKTNLYNLDIKPGVEPKNIRRAEPAQSSVLKPEYSVGQAVEYFSDSAARWVRAEILAYNASSKKYDLNVKQGVAVFRLRQLQEEPMRTKEKQEEIVRQEPNAQTQPPSSKESQTMLLQGWEKLVK